MGPDHSFNLIFSTSTNWCGLIASIFSSLKRNYNRVGRRVTSSKVLVTIMRSGVQSYLMAFESRAAASSQVTAYLGGTFPPSEGCYPRQPVSMLEDTRAGLCGENLLSLGRKG